MVVVGQGRGVLKPSFLSPIGEPLGPAVTLTMPWLGSCGVMRSQLNQAARRLARAFVLNAFWASAICCGRSSNGAQGMATAMSHGSAVRSADGGAGMKCGLSGHASTVSTASCIISRQCRVMAGCRCNSSVRLNGMADDVIISCLIHAASHHFNIAIQQTGFILLRDCEIMRQEQKCREIISRRTLARSRSRHRSRSSANANQAALANPVI